MIIIVTVITLISAVMTVKVKERNTETAPDM